MEFRLHNDCFEHNHYKALSVLLRLVDYENEMHKITVDDPDILNSNLYYDLDKNDRDLITDSFNASVIDSTPYEGESIDVKSQGCSEYTLKVFTLDEAVRYIQEPLWVLLENDLYDGHFIKCLIRNFGTQRAKAALAKNQIRMGHSGGCGNTKNTLEEKIKGFDGKSKFLRIYIVWDGDQRYPKENVTKYDTDKGNLDSMNIGYHILHKREMENYMPKEAIQEIAVPKFRAWFDAYCSLTDIQKDYYDIDHGFLYEKVTYSSANRDQLPSSIKILFESVSNANFDILKEGLKIGNFKRSFSERFESSPYSNKATLLARTLTQPNPHELQDIADAINRLL